MERADITITALAEYIEKVTNLPETVYYSSTSNMFHIYRGQSDVNWDLNPSAYRYGRFKYEQNYICEMETIAPDNFTGLSRIDKLVKMQHYGLPTRLLDFSRNSLVALYFACCSEPTKDGAVYEIHALPMLRQDATPISIVMKYLFEYSNAAFVPDRFLEELNKSEYSDKFYAAFRSPEALREVLSRTYGIYPQLTNKRVKNQEGVFVMAGMEINYQGDCWTFQPKLQPTVQSITEESRRIIIPHEAKERILQMLDRIGINERYLLPGLEADTRSVVQHVESQQFLCRGRHY